MYDAVLNLHHITQLRHFIYNYCTLYYTKYFIYIKLHSEHCTTQNTLFTFFTQCTLYYTKYFIYIKLHSELCITQNTVFTLNYTVYIVAITQNTLFTLYGTQHIVLHKLLYLHYITQCTIFEFIF